MPRVHFVKKARRAVPHAGIAAGDSYYWWQFAFAPKSFSKTPPKPSQLTRSDFLQQFYALQEDFDVSGATDAEDIKDKLEELKSELKSLADEQESKKSSMPDQLQESETGELLQARADKCRELVDEIDNIILKVDAVNSDSFEDESEYIEACREEASSGVDNMDWSDAG